MTDREAGEFAEAFEVLPQDAKWAISWAVGNMKTIEKICRNPGMTRPELEKRIADAQEKQDYMKLMLLLFTEFYMDKE